MMVAAKYRIQQVVGHEMQTGHALRDVHTPVRIAEDEAFMEGLHVSDKNVFRDVRPVRRDGGDALKLVLTLPQRRGQFVHQREQLLPWHG